MLAGEGSLSGPWRILLAAGDDGAARSALLAEGRRLGAEGCTVVLGCLEHATDDAVRLDGIPVIPLIADRDDRHRVDLSAITKHHADVVLLDDLTPSEDSRVRVAFAAQLASSVGGPAPARGAAAGCASASWARSVDGWCRRP
jgi:Osmosensitive K+ channel His kinase sensor domain